MSIKGFNIGGQIQKYDYESLDNLPGEQGVSDDLKQALLQIAQKVAYVDDDGATYYHDLYDALYPPATLVSIDAVFTQGSTVIYDTDSLDSLKTMLVVTGTYDDSTTSMIPSTDYTLSGTLTAGTSTITVTYSGKSDTFTVTVTADPTLSSISAVYTQSGTVYPDTSLDSLKDDLVVTATYSDSSTATVAAADYTLSGTLTAGTSTVTVSYGGKTTTFSVTVTNFLYAWDFKTSLVDTVGGTETFVNSATVSGGTISQTSDGLKFTTEDSAGFQGNCATQNAIIALNTAYVIKIKFGAMDAKLTKNANSGQGFIVAVPIAVYWHGGDGKFKASFGNSAFDIFSITDNNYFANKLLEIDMFQNGSVKFYADGALIGELPSGTYSSAKKVGFGNGSQKITFADMVIESVTVR